MADTPLGRGLIEIGANLAPLEKGLAEAQAKTRAALGGAAVGGGATTTGGATPVDASKSAKEYTSEMSRAKGVVANVATESNKVATNTKDAATQSKFMNIGVAATAAGIAALGRALDQLWKGIKGFGDSARQLGAEMRAIESQFRSDITSSLDPLSQRTQEIEKARLAALEQLETQRQERGIIGDIVGYFSDEAELAVKTQKINEEANKAQIRNQENARKMIDAQIESIELENEKKRIALEPDDIKRAEEERLLALKIANQKISDVEDQRLKDQLIIQRDLINQEFDEKIKKIHERRAEEKQAIAEQKQDQIDADKKVALEKEQAAKAFAEAQRAAFGQLQGQINSLFNTGNLEVGINRVAGLIQILIDKTERG